MTKKIVALTLILIFSAQGVFALMGTRPLGMGGAFTAVADDPTAAYWNPAGLALNPEVALSVSTMGNNQNTWIGDNTLNLKMCYETEMNPFVWIAGVGLASALAFQGALYLKDKGVVQKNWGRGGEAPQPDEALTPQATGTEEVVSLKQELKNLAKQIGGDAKETAKDVARSARDTAKDIARHTTVNVGLFPYSPRWYRPNYERPNYWEQPAIEHESTKAQFALGLSWLHDNTSQQKVNWYTLSLASGFEQRIAVGLGVNLYDATDISTNNRGIGADLDVGIIAKPVEYIAVGLTTKRVLTTDIHWQSGPPTRGYPMSVNAGIAVKPIYSLTLAADLHNIFNQNNQTATMHYGAEAVLLPGLLARAGLDNNSKTAGLSLAVGNLIIDYAYLGGSYNRTQMVGGSWRF